MTLARLRLRSPSHFDSTSGTIPTVVTIASEQVAMRNTQPIASVMLVGYVSREAHT